jgi:hypothetical protein
MYTHTSHSSMDFSSKGRKTVINNQFSKQATLVLPKKEEFGSLEFILWHTVAA